jgi:hypothetical protein
VHRHPTLPLCLTDLGRTDVLAVRLFGSVEVAVPTWVIVLVFVATHVTRVLPTAVRWGAVVFVALIGMRDMPSQHRAEFVRSLAALMAQEPHNLSQSDCLEVGQSQPRTVV